LRPGTGSSNRAPSPKPQYPLPPSYEGQSTWAGVGAGGGRNLTEPRREQSNWVDETQWNGAPR
jgi:hypothetical protein